MCRCYVRSSGSTLAAAAERDRTDTPASGSLGAAPHSAGDASLPAGYACRVMPQYRIVFPPRPGEAADQSRTARIDSGDEIYSVGTVIVHHGERWLVTEAQLDEANPTGETDLLVWPDDDS